MIVRIWSTDWVKDPISQIERVVAVFDQRRAQASEPRLLTRGLGRLGSQRMRFR